MNTVSIDLILGFILGVISNFIAWGLLFHYFVPKIKFSPSINKTPLEKTLKDKSGTLYRFKIENAGWRNIIDIELTARLSIKGLKKPFVWSIIYIPLSPDGNSSYRIPILFPAKQGKVSNRKVMFIYTNSRDILLDWSVFPLDVRKKARNKRLLLEELLKLGTEAKLEIQAYCYDSFSGTRKLYTSKSYTISDIVEESFDPTSLETLPKSEKKRIGDLDEIDNY